MLIANKKIISAIFSATLTFQSCKNLETHNEAKLGNKNNFSNTRLKTNKNDTVTFSDDQASAYVIFNTPEGFQREKTLQVISNNSDLFSKLTPANSKYLLHIIKNPDTQQEYVYVGEVGLRGGMKTGFGSNNSSINLPSYNQAQQTFTNMTNQARFNMDLELAGHGVTRIGSDIGNYNVFLYQSGNNGFTVTNTGSSSSDHSNAGMVEIESYSNDSFFDDRVNEIVNYHHKYKKYPKNDREFMYPLIAKIVNDESIRSGRELLTAELFMQRIIDAACKKIEGERQEKLDVYWKNELERLKNEAKESNEYFENLKREYEEFPIEARNRAYLDDLNSFLEEKKPENIIKIKSRLDKHNEELYKREEQYLLVNDFDQGDCPGAYELTSLFDLSRKSDKLGRLAEIEKKS